MYKNRWNTLCDDIRNLEMIFYYPSTIWFDKYNPNILYYCVPHSAYKPKLKFRYFDIRDNKQTWNVIESVEPYNSLEEVHVF